MTIAQRLFTTVPGATFIIAAELTNVVILRICRQGLGHNDSNNVAPGNREYEYTSSLGRVDFLDPFVSDEIPPWAPVGFSNPEKIYVRYKY
jgi:hypothetical protein